MSTRNPCQCETAGPKKCEMLDPYIATLLGLGVVVLLVAWLPLALKTIPLSLAIVCVALGAGIFAIGWLEFDPEPRTYDTVVERLCEAVVIISLMGAGLKIDRQIGLRAWATRRAGRKAPFGRGG